MDELLKALIDKAVKTTSGNTRDTIAYDLFQATGSSAALADAGRELAAKVPADVTVLVAPGLGAAALAAATALALMALGRPVTTLAVRDPRKSRDGERLVEGPVPSEPAKAMFIDDTITSGATYRQAVETMAKAAPHIAITCCGVLLDAWHAHGSRTIHASGTPVYSVVRRHDLNVTRDIASVAEGGPAVPAFGKLVLKQRVAELDVERQKSSLVLTDTSIITADDSHVVRANDYEGTLLWEWQSDNPRTKGVVQDLALQADGSLIFGSYDGTVVKLNSSDGAVLWRTQVCSSIHATPVVDTDGAIYIVCEEFDRDRNQPGGSIAKLAPDGSLTTKVRFSDAFAPCRCTVLADTVIVTANDKVVRCLDKDTFTKKIWSVATNGMVRGAMLHSQGVLCVADEAGWLYGFDPATGAVIWQRHMSRGFPNAVPVLIDDWRAVFCDNSLYAHAIHLADGTREWLTRFRSRVTQRPTVLDAERLLFMGVDGDASIVEAATGIKQAQTNTERSFLQPGGYRNGKYAQLSTNGTLLVWSLQ